jgi:hypothetical protein
LILRYNPQPTQPCDDAPVAIFIGGDSSGYGNDNSDNGVGDSDNGGDGGDNGSGKGSGSSNEEAAVSAMAAGANIHQLKAAVEKRLSWWRRQQQ